MSREVRMVPKDWEHPKNDRGDYVPLYNDEYGKDANNFMEKAMNEGLDCAVKWFGGAPDKDDYMPDFDDEATHVMMYETTTEGTPISPAFPSAEELARWLADSNASAFANDTATYGEWLIMCKEGWSVSGVIRNGVLVSGVSAMS